MIIPPEMKQDLAHSLRGAVGSLPSDLHPHERVERLRAISRDVVHGVLSTYYAYDAATDLYWLTARQAGQIGTETGETLLEAIAPFRCELGLADNRDTIRFHLRQVGPFQTEGMESSVAQTNDLAGGDAGHTGDGCIPGTCTDAAPDTAVGGCAHPGGSVRPDSGPDAPVTKQPPGDVRQHGASRLRLAGGRAASKLWTLLD